MITFNYQLKCFISITHEMTEIQDKNFRQQSFSNKCMYYVMSEWKQVINNIEEC